jgi:undecaprenyl-diphosphatase
MEFVQAIFLGLVQGVTEFLPISSTAHLKVVPVVLGWGDPGVAFTAVVQLGSIGAVLWYFAADLWAIARGCGQAFLKGTYNVPEVRLALAIALGTIPIVIGGLGIKLLVPDFDCSPLRSLTAIAIASIVMALLLAVAERVGGRSRGYDRLTIRDGIGLGLAQALALVPGVSRSGATLTAGLSLSLERVAATRFSFLLGIPAITIAGIVEFLGLVRRGFSVDSTLCGAAVKTLPVTGGMIAVGTLSSAIFSYLAIAWLLKFFQTHSSWVFVWYRLIFGTFLLLGIGLGWFA